VKVTITPERARDLLARNPNNRNMSKPLARKYASDMKDGLWQYNGDPIRVSKSGDLLDGQHRLEACVIAGVPFDAELIEGLSVEIMPTIDSGRRRSAGDALHIMTGGSAQNNAGLAASTRQVLNYVCGFAPNQPQSTPAIIRMINRYPEIGDAYRLGMRCKGVLTPGPLGAVLFIGQRAPTMGDRAVSFVEGVSTGQNLDAGDPRLAVREAFINRRTTAPGVRLPELIWCFIATARAWNAWATGQELERLSVRKNMDGSWSIPDIIGGPPRGEGVESLANVRRVGGRRSVREREEAMT
jgi:hypothetical protein